VAERENGKFGAKAPQPTQGMQRISVASRNVKEKHMWRNVGLHSLHGIPTAGNIFQLPGVGVANRPQQVQERRFTAYNKNARGFDRILSHVF
jgi:hypothetical protein